MLACVQGAGGVVTKSSFLGPFCFSAVSPTVNKHTIGGDQVRVGVTEPQRQKGRGEQPRPGGWGSRPLRQGDSWTEMR